MFEFLFKYPPAVFSQGTFVLLGHGRPGSLPLQWSRPPSSWRHCLVASQSVHAIYARRAAVVVWVLQICLVALVLLLLWQPALSVAALKPQQNIVAVVVDDSRSMASKDGERREACRGRERARGRSTEEVGERFQVRLYKLGATIKSR